MKRRESHSSPSARGAVTRKKVSEQAADVLRQHLVERANVAFKFPPISELARQLGVSVVNAHRAVSALKDEGLVRVVHGKGVYSNLPIGQPIQTENGPAIGLLCYSETVALDFLRGRNAFYNIVMQGAFQEAAAAGYRVALHWLPENTAGNPSLWPDIERFGVKNRLSGLLMLCLTDRRLVRWIAKRSSPCILVDHWCPGLKIDTVNPDNRGAACLGTHSLLAAGHREIAYVFHHKPETNPPRLEGYYDALRAAGIPLRRNLVVLEDISEMGGERAIRALVRRGARFTAALTFDDAQARGALKAARTLKKKLEVVTFGAVNDFGDPALGLIDLRPDEVGRLAVRRLLRRIRSPALATEDLVAPVRVAPWTGATPAGPAYGARKAAHALAIP